MFTNHWMVVVENMHTCIVGIAYTTDAPVTRTKMTMWIIRGNTVFGYKGLKLPWPVVAVCGINNPFPPQRVPSFFPLSFEINRRFHCLIVAAIYKFFPGGCISQKSMLEYQPLYSS
jgi:hypothetical protein